MAFDFAFVLAAVVAVLSAAFSALTASRFAAVCTPKRLFLIKSPDFSLAAACSLLLPAYMILFAPAFPGLSPACFIPASSAFLASGLKNSWQQHQLLQLQVSLYDRLLNHFHDVFRHIFLALGDRIF